MPDEIPDHAPLPWRADLGTHAVLGADGEECAFCMPTRAVAWEEACFRRDRTIQYIVRAANHHAQLVAALDHLLNMLGLAIIEGRHVNEAIEDAKAALASALSGR